MKLSDLVGTNPTITKQDTPTKGRPHPILLLLWDKRRINTEPDVMSRFGGVCVMIFSMNICLLFTLFCIQLPLGEGRRERVVKKESSP
jgi:hypothetical protein